MTELPEKIKQFENAYRWRILSSCLLAVLLAGFYDVIFDLAVSGLHAFFEWIEFVLEEMIEAMFHTTRKQTQTIVFYMLLTAGSFVCYRFGLKLIQLYRTAVTKIVHFNAAYQKRVSDRWKRLSAVQKLKIVLSGSAGLGVMVYLTLS